MGGLLPHPHLTKNDCPHRAASLGWCRGLCPRNTARDAERAWALAEGSPVLRQPIADLLRRLRDQLRRLQQTAAHQAPPAAPAPDAPPPLVEPRPIEVCPVCSPPGSRVARQEGWRESISGVWSEVSMPSPLQKKNPPPDGTRRGGLAGTTQDAGVPGQPGDLAGWGAAWVRALAGNLDAGPDALRAADVADLLAKACLPDHAAALLAALAKGGSRRWAPLPVLPVLSG